MSSANKIFVQIPSYRDPQLVPTLVDMVSAARNPQDLRIVVCWQHGEDERLGQFLDAGFEQAKRLKRNIHRFKYRRAEIQVIDVNHLESGGCGWARSEIQKHYRSEKYALQIDSHHRFVSAWDASLIGMLEALRAECPKPILTGYPPPFVPHDDPSSRESIVGIMIATRFSPPGVLRFDAVTMPDWISRKTPMRARFLSGGFIFSDGRFVEEVPNDPEHFFATEEVAMSVRAFTHGYDLFHPHRIILWHYYKRSGPKVWDDHVVGQVNISAQDREHLAYRRTLSLLGIGDEVEEREFGGYGLGTKRTLRQYERYVGLSFQHRGVRRTLQDMDEPSESEFCLPSDEWELGLACARVLRMRVECANIKLELARCDAASIVLHPRDGSDLHRVEIPSDSVRSATGASHIECVIHFTTPPHLEPQSFTATFRCGSSGTIQRIRGNVEEIDGGYISYSPQSEVIIEQT